LVIFGLLWLGCFCRLLGLKCSVCSPIFEGVGKFLLLPAQLAPAFAYWAIWCLNQASSQPQAPMLAVYGKPIHVSPPSIPPLIRLPMTSEPSVATINSSGSRSVLFLKSEGVSVGLGSVSALTHNVKTSARVRPSGCVYVIPPGRLNPAPWREQLSRLGFRPYLNRWVVSS